MSRSHREHNVDATTSTTNQPSMAVVNSMFQSCFAPVAGCNTIETTQTAGELRAKVNKAFCREPFGEVPPHAYPSYNNYKGFNDASLFADDETVWTQCTEKTERIEAPEVATPESEGNDVPKPVEIVDLFEDDSEHEHEHAPMAVHGSVQQQQHRPSKDMLIADRYHIIVKEQGKHRDDVGGKKNMRAPCDNFPDENVAPKPAPRPLSEALPLKSSLSIKSSFSLLGSPSAKTPVMHSVRDKMAFIRQQKTMSFSDPKDEDVVGIDPPSIQNPAAEVSQAVPKFVSEAVIPAALREILTEAISEEEIYADDEEEMEEKMDPLPAEEEDALSEAISEEQSSDETESSSSSSSTEEDCLECCDEPNPAGCRPMTHIRRHNMARAILRRRANNKIINMARSRIASATRQSEDP